MIKQLYTLPTLHFADVYGAGTYNESEYSATGTTTTTTTDGNSTLVNTGVFVLGFVTLAAVILLVALVIRVWRRPAKQQKQSEQSE
jgi:hypothetical protein